MSSAVSWRLSFFVLWLLSFIFIASDPFGLLREYGLFAFLGIIGAIFANSTGAGGGVIFVPFFSQLQLDNVTTVATSFAIQCFGMTAGALTWFAYSRKEKKQDEQWQDLPRVLGYTVPFSVLGIWSVQFMGMVSPDNLHFTFGVFSVLLAVSIFASIPLLKKERFKNVLCLTDKLMLPAVAYVGGIITAWLSVGVGELVAVYLIFRSYNTSFAIACAVILSAFSVWGGVVYHLTVTEAVYWPILTFAGLGAVIGGILAKQVVLYFSVPNLKIFFAGWVLLLGLSSVIF